MANKDRYFDENSLYYQDLHKYAGSCDEEDTMVRAIREMQEAINYGEIKIKILKKHQKENNTETIKNEIKKYKIGIIKLKEELGIQDKEENEDSLVNIL